MNFDYYPEFILYNSSVRDFFIDDHKGLFKRNKQILYLIRHIRTGSCSGKLQGVWWRIFIKSWREL